MGEVQAGLCVLVLQQQSQQLVDVVDVGDVQMLRGAGGRQQVRRRVHGEEGGELECPGQQTPHLRHGGQK